MQLSNKTALAAALPLTTIFATELSLVSLFTAKASCADQTGKVHWHLNGATAQTNVHDHAFDGFTSTFPFPIFWRITFEEFDTREHDSSREVCFMHSNLF